MVDPTRPARETARARRRLRAKRARRRRRRLALLLVLLAVGVGAAVLGPGLVGLERGSRPVVRIARQPLPLPPTRQRAERRPDPHLEPSLGPILELIEQSVNLGAFDLTRPVRIPTRPSPAPRGDQILLSALQTARTTAPAVLLPPRSQPPGPRMAGLSLPEPAFRDPTTGLPTGGPDFDRDLIDGETPPAEPGVPQEPPPATVPEPSVLVLLGLVGLAFFGRRRRPAAD